MLRLYIKNTKQRKSQIVKNIMLRSTTPDIINFTLDDETEQTPYTELQALYDQGYEFGNFVGGVLVNSNILDNSVPEGFDNSILVISEGNTRQKTWREYTIVYEKDNEALITMGWRDGDGNRTYPVTHKEFCDYVDEFSFNSIKHKKDFDAIKDDWEGNNAP